MKYYIEIDDRDIERFRIDNPCKGSHGNCVLVLKDKYNMTIGFELLRDRPHGEWISCSERLPEESGEYYVSGGDKVWICSFLIIPTFKGGWCNNVSNPVVEAWMELPEPYKEEGEDEQ